MLCVQFWGGRQKQDIWLSPRFLEKNKTEEKKEVYQIIMKIKSIYLLLFFLEYLGWEVKAVLNGLNVSF